MKILDVLFYNLSTQLKLDLDTFSKLEEKKSYAKNLSNKFLIIQKLQNYKKLGLNRTFKTNINKYLKDEDCLIMYTLSISFLKANTNIHVSDIKGNTVLFYNAGSVGLVGKQKIKRSKCVLRLISLLVKKASFLSNYPISVHLNNVNANKKFIISKLKTHFLIKIIKIFNQTPHNGCRKKKIRRKKFVKRGFK